MPSLVYHGDRRDAGEYLTGKGWRMDATPRSELFARYGIPVPDLGDEDPLGEIVYISGTR